MTVNATRDPAAAFAAGDFVVYPGHGVGEMLRIDTEHVAGQKTTLFVIKFAQDRMTLRVPLQKAGSAGLRRVSSRRVMQGVLASLKGPPPRRRVVWSRLMTEYSAKINSGDPRAVAEVIRDLHRPVNGRERSHGAQVLYAKALTRLTLEVAAVDRTHIAAAEAKLDLLLNAA